MTEALIKAWEEVLRPFLLRPKRVQVAALCTRTGANGQEVLLITSRGTGRWIVPKGWPIKGKTGSQSALQEAWEEAGVIKAQVEDEPTGSYDYLKQRDNGTGEMVETLVYKVRVRELAKNYPERDERIREWMSPQKAADLVAEPELSALLRAL